MIMMELRSSASPSEPGVYDPAFSCLLVVFNLTPLQQEMAYPGGEGMQLHPLQVSQGGA